MKFSDEFTVPAPFEKVWPVLLDLERVAPCLPGASLTGPQGDGYAGLMKVKLGPLLSSYKGTVAIKSSDPDSGVVLIRARGKDTTGQGIVEALITSTLTGDEAETHVAVDTDMKVTGPAAQFGRGVMEQVSAKMLADFAGRLAKEVGGGEGEGETTAAEPAGDGPSDEAAAPPQGDTGEPADEGYFDLGAASRAAVGQVLARHSVEIAAGLVLLLAAFLLGRRSARRAEPAAQRVPQTG